MKGIMALFRKMFPRKRSSSDTLPLSPEDNAAELFYVFDALP